MLTAAIFGKALGQRTLDDGEEPPGELAEATKMIDGQIARVMA